MQNKTTLAAMKIVTRATTYRHQIVIGLACDTPGDRIVMGTRSAEKGWLCPIEMYCSKRYQSVFVEFGAKLALDPTQAGVFRGHPGF
jgi:hypothetical protein